jgi:pyruvate kinase
MFIRSNRRAKIVATVGPASSSPEKLKALFLAGVDTFRLNFSHGSHEQHEAIFHSIRAIEREHGSAIGILQDLQGPKIRIGTLAGGRTDVRRGDMIRFVCRADGASETKDVPLPHWEIFAAVTPGDELVIDDGRVRVRVSGVDDEFIEAEVTVGGPITDRKGVNVPGARLEISP